MRIFHAIFILAASGLVANVNAAKPNQDVNVVNIPDVTVTNPQTSVTVDNDSANPVPVTVEGANAVQPAQTYKRMVMGGTVHRESEMTVPSGKRFVLEYISVNFAMPPDENPGTRANITVSDITGVCPQDSKMRHVLQVPEIARVSNEITNTIVSHTIKLYAEPEETLCIELNRTNDTFVHNVEVHLTGYYVDVS